MIKPTQKNSLSFFQYSSINALSDESKTIFDTYITSSSLIEAAFFINQCHVLSREFNLFLQKNTLPFIKNLSLQYKESNETVAGSLRTKKAKSIFLKQLGFAQLCEKYGNSYEDHHLKLINPRNTDLNFTYETLQQTQLMHACRINNFGCSRKKIVDWFLKQESTDINMTHISGETAALQAIYSDFCNWDPKPIKKDFLITAFINHPLFNINQIYELQRVGRTKKTTLLLTILAQQEFNRPISDLTDNQQHSRLHKLNLIQLLCDNKADPTIEVDGISALNRAYEIKHPDLIDIFNKAIKH